jgi:hypothetical protein
MFKNDLTFVHKYFVAEKQATLIFMIIGGVAILLSVIFFFFIKSNPQFYKGAAIPMFVIGLIQASVGFTVYNRSDEQRLSISYDMGMEPKAFITQNELPRMNTVMRNFVIYRYVEILLFAVGIGLFFFYRDSGHSFLKGLGLALSIMAIITFVADHFAEKRGAEYREQLQKLAGS